MEQDTGPSIEFEDLSIDECANRCLIDYNCCVFIYTMKRETTDVSKCELIPECDVNVTTPQFTVCKKSKHIRIWKKNWDTFFENYCKMSTICASLTYATVYN